MNKMPLDFNKDIGEEHKRLKIMEIEIQKRIVITQEDVDKIIKDYEKLPKKFHLCMGEWSGNKDDIIREIKKLSEIGKEILLIDYKFNEWMKKEKKLKVK